jgi:Fe-S cluster biosynthesis and repair protein YggX
VNTAKLGTDFVAYHQAVNKVEHTCLNKHGWTSWQCCNTHRALALENHRLKMLALEYQPDESRGFVLSPAWWLNLGRPEIYHYIMSSY